MPPSRIDHEPLPGVTNGPPIPAAMEAPAQDKGHELSSDKLSQIRALVTDGFGGGMPEVLFSHSSGIGFTRDHGYRTLSYSSVSEHGIATGSRTRVIATAEIAEAMPELPIIANSYNRFDPNEPTMASVVEAELVKRGVDKMRISKEFGSFSTITQITEMVRLSVLNQWKRIAVLTNEYHLPRMQAMYEMLDTIVDDPDFQKTLTAFKEQGSQVSFVCAEPIMRLIDPHFIGYLDRVEKSAQFQHTLATEAQGLKDLLAGKYRVVLHPEMPRS